MPVRYLSDPELAHQAGLGSGDLWVSGSRRYTDPVTLLLPPDRWAGPA